MQFCSAFKKTMILLKTKEAINFFFKNALQKKRIKKLVQTVQNPQNSKLDFNTDLLISVKPAADRSIKALMKQINTVVILIQMMMKKIKEQNNSVKRVTEVYIET